MSDDFKPTPEQRDDLAERQLKNAAGGCGGVFVKLLIGVVVLFVVAVAFVFGVCFLG